MDIVAHRGASGDAPENTLAAFRLAWEQRADGIELDVHLSRDGRIMVHHDADTGRCAGASHVIADTDSRILRGLDVGRWKGERFAGQRMPFLDEVLATVPAGRRVLVELKCGPAIVPALVAGLAALDPGRLRLALISFELDSLAAAHAALPQVPCYYLVEAVPGGYGDDLIQLACEHGFRGLDPESTAIDARFAAAARAAGLDLLTWTVNDPARVRPLRDFGLSALTTDWPALLRQALQAADR